MHTFSRSSLFSVPARTLFEWHESPGALAALIPPGDPVSVEVPPPGLHNGARAVLRIGPRPLSIRWVAEHRDYANRDDDGGQFTDVQIHGPFAAWEHTHTVRAHSPSESILTDSIRFRLRAGTLGRLLALHFVLRKLDKLFEFRHNATAAALGATRSPLPDLTRNSAQDPAA